MLKYYCPLKIWEEHTNRLSSDSTENKFVNNIVKTKETIFRTTYLYVYIYIYLSILSIYLHT